MGALDTNRGAVAGVIGRPDEQRDEIIPAFVALQRHYQPTGALRQHQAAPLDRDPGAISTIEDAGSVHARDARRHIRSTLH